MLLINLELHVEPDMICLQNTHKKYVHTYTFKAGTRPHVFGFTTRNIYLYALQGTLQIHIFIFMGLLASNLQFERRVLIFMRIYA